MTEEQTTVQGTVAKVQVWASGKGFFLNFEDDENDYYKWGKTAIEVGDKAAFSCKPGSKTWEDKVELVKPIEVGTAKVDVAQLKKKTQDKVLDGIKNGETFYMDKQELIVKQVCLKVAGEMHSHLIERSAKVPGKNIANSVTEMSEMFFLYIMGIEGSGLPEPPEPPEPESEN